ncbi:hypothetical protein WOLCODRAFT_72066, partial [Wolfiporia cocos MD-104 SS10]
VQDDICKIIGISSSSLYHWQHIFEDFGRAVKPPSLLCGRIRIITHTVMDSIHLLYQNHPDTYLNKLLFWLAVHHEIAAEKDEEEWTVWHDEICNHFLGTGAEFVFIDETSKNDHTYYCRYGYALRGETPQLIDVFVCGQCYSLVTRLTLDRYIAAKVIPGSFDS